MKLVDKVAIVTGGTKGIGKAIAKALLSEGARVVIASRNTDNINSAVKALSPISKQIYAKHLDVSSFEQSNELVNWAIGQFQKIDILVNNAGIGHFAKLTDITESDYDKVMNTNLKGVFNICKAVLPHMIEKKNGNIINIASLGGKHGFASGTIYCASKFALRGFSESLMLEVREHNIRVISIYPGSVDTEFSNESNISNLNKDKKLKPEDIANAVILAVTADRRCLMSEIDIRPTLPK